MTLATEQIQNSIAGHEYLYIKCLKCAKLGEDPPTRAKLAKNKGAYWKTAYNPEWLYDFMLEHGGYDHKPEDIVLEWEK